MNTNPTVIVRLHIFCCLHVETCISADGLSELHLNQLNPMKLIQQIRI